MFNLTCFTNHNQDMGDERGKLKHQSQPCNVSRDVSEVYQILKKHVANVLQVFYQNYLLLCSCSYLFILGPHWSNLYLL